MMGGSDRFRIGIPQIVTLALCLWAAVASARPPTPEDAEFLKGYYDKVEHRIPVRDGVHLHTVVYIPKDRTQAYPIMLCRTPYSAGPYGPDEYKLGDLNWYINLVKEGYIFAFQDVRGRYMSEGTWTNMTPQIAAKGGPTDVDESSDTYDTVDWLINHVPANNGNVGMVGISYRGFYAAAGAIDAHPALKAVSPQGPMSDVYFDDFHHNGAFLPVYIHSLPVFGHNPTAPTPKAWWPNVDYGTPTQDGYKLFLEMGSLRDVGQRYLPDNFFWQQMVEHPDYDEFWQQRDLLPHLKDIRAAVMTVGGLFDAEDLYGSFNVYKAIESQSDRNTTNMLVMGPWVHGGWSRTDGRSLGDVYFGEGTSTFYQEEIETPFFNYHLKGEGSLDLPEAMVYETGANRWRRFEQWPPKCKRRKLYLQPERALAFSKPRGKGFAEFISDPRSPVPHTGYIDFGIAREYMTADQRFASRRPDVLWFQSEALQDSTTLAGPVLARLYVSTSESAADWIVKLIDVYPDDHPPYPHQPEMNMGGYQQMVRSEVLRGRYRNSFSHPEPFEPQRVTEVEIVLQDVLHTFKPGHRIMVQVQSTWFPLVDRNPQQYVDNIYLADPEDFVTATHRVYYAGRHPSHLEVGVLAAE
jgi:uncharacterized protein